MYLRSTSERRCRLSGGARLVKRSKIPCIVLAAWCVLGVLPALCGPMAAAAATMSGPPTARPASASPCAPGYTCMPVRRYICMRQGKTVPTIRRMPGGTCTAYTGVVRFAYRYNRRTVILTPHSLACRIKHPTVPVHMHCTVHHRRGAIIEVDAGITGSVPSRHMAYRYYVLIYVSSRNLPPDKRVFVVVTHA
jgi:hypothetical protein